MRYPLRCESHSLDAAARSNDDLETRPAHADSTQVSNSAATSFSTLKGSFGAPESSSPPPTPSRPRNSYQLPTPTKSISQRPNNAVTFIHLPPTPATTPQKRGQAFSSPSTHKRACLSSTSPNPLYAPALASLSKRAGLFRRNASTPAASIAYLNTDLRTKPTHHLQRTRTSFQSEVEVSEAERERVIESVMKQVNWDVVEKDVASNRVAGRRLYKEWVEECLRGGEEEEAMEDVGWRGWRRY
ncbi:hypothetical protein ACLMJK_002959 [Lecanora helva]